MPRIVAEFPGNPSKHRLDLIRAGLVKQLGPQLNVTRDSVTCHPMSDQFSLGKVEVRLSNLDPNISKDSVGCLSIDIGDCIGHCLTEKLRRRAPDGIEIRVDRPGRSKEEPIAFTWTWAELGT